MAVSIVNIDTAVQLLKADGVIAYPTEGVFGLGCDPRSEIALQRLLAIKGRDADKGFILVASTINQLDAYIDYDALQSIVALEETWPGPVTWLLPTFPHHHPLLRGQFTTQAMRVSAHPVVQAICRAFDHPIVSTSANLSGKPSLMTAAAVEEELGEHIDVIVEGSLGGLKGPTEIRHGLTGEIIRKGVG